MGVRIALGAARRHVLGMILRQGFGLVALGVSAGFVASLARTRLLLALLFEVGPADLPTAGGVALLLTAVTLLACYLPARRAARVDPMIALRHE